MKTLGNWLAGLVLIIILVLVAHETHGQSTVYIHSSPPKGCEPRRAARNCRRLVQNLPNCRGWLKWVGRGCIDPQSKTREIAEGGCQFKSFCDFSCQELCKKQHQCTWVLTNENLKGKCVNRFTISSELIQPSLGTKRVMKAIGKARLRWNRILAGDKRKFALTPNVTQPICEGLYQLRSRMILQDLHVIYDFVSIDGRGGVYASAAPCLNWADGTTAVGVIRIDVDDLETTLKSDRLLMDVITHELGHILGIGSKWRDLGLVPNLESSSEPEYAEYIGANGGKGFRRLGGSGNPKVDLYGSATTRGKHWSEDSLEKELMSPYFQMESNALSQVSGLSLIDLGYRLLDFPKFEDFHIAKVHTDDTRMAFHESLRGVRAANCGGEFPITNETVMKELQYFNQ